MGKKKREEEVAPPESVEAAEQPKPPHIERNEVYRILKTDFTEKEKLIIACQMANCVRDLKRLSDDLSSVSSQYKTDIKKQEAEMASLAEKLNTGWEMRRTECVEEKNFDNGSVLVFRKDSCATVEERAMTGEERQMALFKEGQEKGEPPTETPDLPEDTNQFYSGGTNAQE